MPCEGYQKSIPQVKGECIAIILWWFNLFYPGAGTFLVSCLQDGTDVVKDQVIVAILQMLTAPCLVGWIWSVWWGALIYKNSSQ